MKALFQFLLLLGAVVAGVADVISVMPVGGPFNFPEGMPGMGAGR